MSAIMMNTSTSMWYNSLHSIAIVTSSSVFQNLHVCLVGDWWCSGLMIVISIWLRWTYACAKVQTMFLFWSWLSLFWKSCSESPLHCSICLTWTIVANNTLQQQKESAHQFILSIWLKHSLKVTTVYNLLHFESEKESSFIHSSWTQWLCDGTKELDLWHSYQLFGTCDRTD